jgi:hypothetical protein
VEGVPQLRTERDMKRVAVDLGERLAHEIEAITERWKGHTSTAIDAFLATRVARERAIAAHIEVPSDSLFQTSLFDSRAQRWHGTHHAMLLDAQQQAAARVASLQSGAPIGAIRHQLLLAVLP